MINACVCRLLSRLSRALQAGTGRVGDNGGSVQRGEPDRLLAREAV